MRILKYMKLVINSISQQIITNKNDIKRTFKKIGEYQS